MKKLIILFLLTFLLFGCEKSEKYVDSSFFAMDTVIDIRISQGELDEASIIAECEGLIADIESVISKSAEGSDTYIANTEIDHLLDFSPIFEELIKLSSEYSALTGGAFDITVGTLKELWEKCAEEGREPTAAELESSLEKVGFEGLTLGDGILEKSFKETKLDFGAVGKGYAAQKVCRLLEERGVSGAILSFGGNVALVGAKRNGEPYRVGVKDPENTDDVIGYLLLEGGYVSVSGDYERHIEIGDKIYNHIIDPTTGYPVSNGIHSVVVVSDDGALADALSTALFVMGIDAAKELYSSGKCDFEAIFVADDGIFATAGLDGIFTPKKGMKITFFDKQVE